jgi:uncharacterized protein YecT (DUF1311 family)
MRKGVTVRYFGTTLLLGVVLGTVCAQQSPEYRACSDGAKTQVAMNACASDEAARADKQLNDVYRTLLQKTTDTTAATKIKVAERAWVTYRNAYVDAMYPAENKQAEYGSVYPMEADLLRAKLTQIQIAALQDLSQQAGGASQSLPEGFTSSVRAVKAKTRVPILLPSTLPDPIGKAKDTVVQSVAEDSYAISLYYELGIGDAGFAANFAAQAKPDYTPEDLANVQRTALAQGLIGFFRPVSCGGSCAPANLWWQQNGTLYQIQLKLSSAISERDQLKALTAAANSAITAGPR